MAEIVLVHGIAQEQESSDSLEQAWTPNLAGGVRIAGFGELADRLRRASLDPDGIDVRMAFYGAVFLKEGSMGQGVRLPKGDAADLAESLAFEWLKTAATREYDGSDQDIAKREWAWVQGGHPDARVMGVPGTRSALVALARIPWFARAGQNLVSRFVTSAVGQVALYMTDPSIRTAAISSVVTLVGPETRIIIGHSLGSVVAYDAIRSAEFPIESLPCLVTLGSPLGLPNIIYDRLDPQPPTYPTRVKHWVNISAPDDFVASVPDLAPIFSLGKPSAARFDGYCTVDNGSQPHSAAHYLTKRQTGAAVGAAMEAHRRSVG